jgi:2-polyprenyl-3-methyl-5-hydroxy-6-metoxy-1,4-benzoquinol methylase
VTNPVQPTGTTELDRQDRQSGNQQWWTDNTMSYDWKDSIASEKYSAGWYDEIDQRFLFGARLFNASTNPFTPLMGLDQLAGKRVLEIGCGMGMHSEMLVRAGANLTAIDISPTSIESSKRRFALKGLEGEFCQMDAEHLDFPDDHFDFVWSWGVIHHSAYTGRIVREIHRVLKPGGRAGIMVYATDGMSAYITFVRRYLFGFWRGKSLDDLLWKDADGFTARFYTKDAWRDLLSTFFEPVTVQLCGQDADVVPLPRQMRRPLLKLISPKRQRRMAAQWGSMIFAHATKPDK